MQRMIFIALQRRQIVKIRGQAHIVLVAVAVPVDAQPMQPLYFSIESLQPCLLLPLLLLFVCAGA